MKKIDKVVLGFAIFMFATFFISMDVYADCPLGAKVTKDLVGILRLFKIAAPLLCMGLSIFEALQAIMKGDAGIFDKGDTPADIKRVAKRLAKRMMYTVLLFFVPFFVDQLMQLGDVWNADGTCDLSDQTYEESSEELVTPSE